MNNYALVRFTRQRSEDDDVIRSHRLMKGVPGDLPIGVENYWDQLLHEMATSDLPVRGAYMLHFEDMPAQKGNDVYVIYALVPSRDDDAVAFATRMQTEGFDQGMAGFFQVIAMMPESAATGIYASTAGLPPVPRLTAVG